MRQETSNEGWYAEDDNSLWGMGGTALEFVWKQAWWVFYERILPFWCMILVFGFLYSLFIILDKGPKQLYKNVSSFCCPGDGKKKRKEPKADLAR